MTVEADLPDFFRAVGIATKTLRVMKLTAIFLLVGCLGVSARGRAQDRVTLHLKQVSLETVLEKIQAQTGYSYSYSEKDIPPGYKLDLWVQDVSIGEVMDQCLKGLPLSYKIVGKLIIIKKKTDLSDTPEPPAILVTARGVVLNDVGQPLAEANVTLKETRRGTVTNAKGEYIYPGAPIGGMLVISFTGYLNEEVKEIGRAHV